MTGGLASEGAAPVIDKASAAAVDADRRPEGSNRRRESAKSLRITMTKQESRIGKGEEKVGRRMQHQLW